MKKSSALIALFPCFMISCNEMMTEQLNSLEQQTVIATVVQEPKTKNAIIDNDVTDIRWTASDAINVFFGESVSSKFVTEESGKQAKFKGSIDVVVGGGEGLDDDTSLWGVYPYKSSTTCDGKYVYYTLQAEQKAAENTFAKELFPQIARSRNFYMSFYNLCASIRFTVTSDDIKAVSLKGNSDELIAGRAKISMESLPIVESVELGEKELKMNAPDGGFFKPGVTYYFVLFPTEFKNGLSITYYKESTHATYSYDKPYSLGRNKFSCFKDRDANLTFEDGGPGEGSETLGDDGKTYVNLSEDGTANCYLVQKAGDYKFKAVQGNTDGTVGNVKSVEVLWESFGTTTAPNVGDIIASTSYHDGYIRFSTPETFAEGNAVIAAKNAKGVILWSWHIWCASEGWKKQVYYNNAGTMMDRNLGATSAKPGDVGSLGLFYQWGRKDPFLGAGSVSGESRAASTGSWTISSDSMTPVIAEQNPMTFYMYNFNYLPDWCWDSNKTAYDPCPAGWRVPDGGEKGIWVTASGNAKDFNVSGGSRGLNFSSVFGSDATIWYPAAGYLNYDDGSLNVVGIYGSYWSVTPRVNVSTAYYLYFISNGNVYPSSDDWRSYGRSVRCLQE